MTTPSIELSPGEIDDFLMAVNDRYGYDFRLYARASFTRRVQVAMSREKVDTLAALTDLLVGNADCFSRTLDALTVSVTEMFRDPATFCALRDMVFPYLQTFSELKIWHPGCSTGEEVYSLAIFLEEAGLFNRAICYGTDINPRALKSAREGIVKPGTLPEVTRAYIDAGGRYSFSRYYTAAYANAILAPALKRNLLFADHNLVTDQKFGDMNLILCRNVLIYFDRELQRRVVQLLWDSLAVGGFLCLGAREHLEGANQLAGCRVVGKAERIYQKKS